MNAEAWTEAAEDIAAKKLCEKLGTAVGTLVMGLGFVMLDRALLLSASERAAYGALTVGVAFSSATFGYSLPAIVSYGWKARARRLIGLVGSVILGAALALLLVAAALVVAVWTGVSPAHLFGFAVAPLLIALTALVVRYRSIRIPAERVLSLDALAAHGGVSRDTHLERALANAARLHVDVDSGPSRTSRALAKVSEELDTAEGWFHRAGSAIACRLFDEGDLFQHLYAEAERRKQTVADVLTELVRREMEAA